MKRIEMQTTFLQRLWRRLKLPKPTPKRRYLAEQIEVYGYPACKLAIMWSANGINDRAKA